MTDEPATTPAADVRREAAALMRKRAEAATPGPWSCDTTSGVDDLHFGHVGIPVLKGPNTYGPGLADTEHIASWHPAVALAVADMLVYAAESADFFAALDPPVGSEDDPALDVARAYLGSDDA